MYVRPLQHKGQDWMGLYYEHYPSVNAILRNELLARWSRTHRCWYIPLEKYVFDQLKKLLEGKVELDTIELKQFLEERKANESPVFSDEEHQGKETLRTYALTGRAYPELSPVNEAVLKRVVQHLVLKHYSKSTITTYRNELHVFFKLLGPISPEHLSPEDIKRYLQKCVTDGLTESTLHSRINALKYYYERVLNKEKFFFEIPRPKKPLLLPRFFTQDEITSIIKAAGNLKHRTMLMLTYSAGLRVSETITLRVPQVDEGRRCIFIHRAKGKKDRIVQLSPVLVVVLREYKKEYKIAAEGYLFSGQHPGHPYSSRSLQLVLERAKKRAGILKPGSIHALRHSFATHLLDKGTDVTMIMKLLGHNDIKTTLRYLHVTNRDLLQVVSPIDDLNLT